MARQTARSDWVGDAPPSMIGKGETEALLLAFLRLDLPATAEAFRRRYCQVCRLSEHLRESVRAAACLSRRCGLCDPEQLQKEQTELIELVVPLQDPQDARPRDVRAFNEHLVAHGSATAVLALSPSGHIGIGFDRSTLRAALGVAALVFLSGRAGDFHLNVNSGPPDQQRGVVTALHAEARRAAAERQREEQDARVVALYHQGQNTSDIARAMGWGKARARVNDILQRHGLKEKGRKFTEI